MLLSVTRIVRIFFFSDLRKFFQKIACSLPNAIHFRPICHFISFLVISVYFYFVSQILIFMNLFHFFPVNFHVVACWSWIWCFANLWLDWFFLCFNSFSLWSTSSKLSLIRIISSTNRRWLKYSSSDPSPLDVYIFAVPIIWKYIPGIIGREEFGWYGIFLFNRSLDLIFARMLMDFHTCCRIYMFAYIYIYTISFAYLKSIRFCWNINSIVNVYSMVSKAF